MADRGAKYADKKLSEIDRELRKVYRQAQKELTAKLSDFNRSFRQKDREKRQKMDKGEISKQQYKDWLAGQVFMRRQWERKLDQVNEVMLHHNEQAMRIINDSRLDVFAENYYSEAFKANWIIRDVGFNVYSTHAIARLLEKQPQILPKWKVDEEKDYKWNEKKVNNIVQQGIIQGESVDQIGKRLCEGLSSQNESKMTMFARTAITGAQNAGRQVQMEQSAAAGIKVNKRWIATLDNRTRDIHRARDGEEVPYNEEFSGGIEYPGDPTAPPEEVYNCRCTMETVYPEYADRSKQWREDETIDGVPYEEWKEEAKQRLEEKEEKKREAERIARQKEEEEKRKKEAEEKRKKEAEKPKRSRKPFDINSATDIEKIKNQMVKNGWLKSGSLYGLDLDTAKDVYRTYERMINTFPVLKGELGGFYVVRPGTNNMREHTYANCFMQSGSVNLNKEYYSNIDRLKECYKKDVQSGFHPFGTDYKSILYHELGHALDGVLSKEVPTGDFSKDFFETIMNKDGLYVWQPFRDSDVAPLVSRYATKNEKEWFAECIGVMMTAADKDKSSMQRVFEEQLWYFLEGV